MSTVLQFGQVISRQGTPRVFSASYPQFGQIQDVGGIPRLCLPPPIGISVIKRIMPS